MLNHIVLMGRLTRDPELRHIGSGTPVSYFTLACARDYKNPKTGESETDFVDCVAWRGTAEMFCKYYSKGRMAAVSGRLQVRTWTDQDGAKRKAVCVIAESIYFADSKHTSGAGQLQEHPPVGADPMYDDYPVMVDNDGDCPY